MTGWCCCRPLDGIYTSAPCWLQTPAVVNHSNFDTATPRSSEFGHLQTSKTPPKRGLRRSGQLGLTSSHVVLLALQTKDHNTKTKQPNSERNRHLSARHHRCQKQSIAGLAAGRNCESSRSTGREWVAAARCECTPIEIIEASLPNKLTGKINWSTQYPNPAVFLPRNLLKIRECEGAVPSTSA